MNVPAVCPSCGASVPRRFCGQCGEKRLNLHDFSIKHYAEEGVDVLTHFDSKLLRSLWLLLRRPGMLSKDYFLGCRIAYTSPLRLFFFVSVIYFVSLTVLHYPWIPKPQNTQFNTFTTPLDTQLHGNNFYPDLAARQVERTLSRRQLDYPTLERLYDEKVGVYSKTLVFVLIPVIAMLFYALFFRNRRYFAEHLVIATHFWAFALVLIGVLLPAVVVPTIWLSAMIGRPLGPLLTDAVLSYALQGVLVLYLFFMFRRAYAASRGYSALVAAATAWSFFFAVWLFRFLLFEITLRSS
jgi:hypothetical protein